MDTAMIDAHLENIDRRLTHLEQILPTLATKEELRLAIEPLATKEDLRGLRSHLTVLIENQNDKINLLIDFVHSLRPKRPGE